MPALLAVMFTGMRMSVQAELDEFFAHLQQQAQLVRHVSEQAFAQARAKLSLTVVPQLTVKTCQTHVSRATSPTNQRPGSNVDVTADPNLGGLS